MTTRLTRLTGLAMLFGSRLAGITVSLVFMPLYARLLGAHDFGLVALVLSMQALMIMLDLGMSALTTRDLAASKSSSASIGQWKQSEKVLSVYFLALLLPSMVIGALLDQSTILVAACIALFWALTLQNLAQAAMIALGDVNRAALLQVFGVLTRAALTAGTLIWIEASVQAFVAVQLLGAIAHLAANRHFGQRQLKLVSHAPAEPLIELVRRGLPLFLVGAAGAAVLQVDKLLVGTFIGPAALAPYFLATTFCLTPIAVLAGPVVQFFQPPLIRAFTSGEAVALRRCTQNLTIALLTAVLLPTAALWLIREPLIEWWLQDRELASRVAAMSTFLLPAAAVGAIGNVPLALLNARSDFAFQARLSAGLTVVTLTAVAFAASQKQLLMVCWIFLGYYTLVTACLWWRAGLNSSTQKVAVQSGALSLTATLLTCMSIAIALNLQ